MAFLLLCSSLAFIIEASSKNLGWVARVVGSFDSKSSVFAGEITIFINFFFASKITKTILNS
jgi:hypothetical protein